MPNELCDITYSNKLFEYFEFSVMDEYFIYPPRTYKTVYTLIVGYIYALLNYRICKDG